MPSWRQNLRASSTFLVAKITDTRDHRSVTRDVSHAKHKHSIFVEAVDERADARGGSGVSPKASVRMLSLAKRFVFCIRIHPSFFSQFCLLPTSRAPPLEFSTVINIFARKGSPCARSAAHLLTKSTRASRTGWRSGRTILWRLPSSSKIRGELSSHISKKSNTHRSVFARCLCSVTNCSGERLNGYIWSGQKKLGVAFCVGRFIRKVGHRIGKPAKGDGWCATMAGTSAARTVNK